MRLPLVVAVLIAYGSLYPFRFVVPEDIGRALEGLVRDRRFWTSLSDVLGNAGLFVPFGIANVWANPQRSRWSVLIRTVLAGCGLAVGLQVVQLWIPSRSAALADVVWNGVGLLAGSMIGLAAREVAGRGHAGVVVRDSSALALIALWGVAHLAPFVPTLDGGELRATLRLLLVDPNMDYVAAAYTAAQVVLVGQLIVAVFGPRGARLVCALTVGSVLVAKLLLIGRAVDLSTVVGFLGGFGSWLLWHGRRRPLPASALAAVLIVVYGLQALTPLTWRETPAAFSWIPLAASLQGSMLTNLRALATASFVLGGCVWLARAAGHGVAIVSVGLAGWALGLELAQRWIVGRTPSITEPLLPLAAGLLMSSSSVPSSTTPIGVPHASGSAARHALHLSRPQVSALVLAAAFTAIVLGLAAILRLSDLPYNVYSLFHNGASLLALSFFALTLLWIGGGAMLVALLLARRRFPFLVLPMATLFVSLVSYSLLSASVTYESIDDVIGSNNLFIRVTQDSIWGESWRTLFLATNADDIVSFIERRVRYTALYSPLVVCTALALAAGIRSARSATMQILLLVASAAVWLFLSGRIVLTWAATDNLTELIARDGPFNLGGIAYLFGIVALISANVALLMHATDRPERLPLIALFSAAAVPLGWLLLTTGLEQSVEKYGAVFSGAQFLLGPDRQRTLSDTALFVRWAVVQIGSVGLIWLGAWILRGFVPDGKPTSTLTVEPPSSAR